MLEGSSFLTHSRISSFKSCRRRHWFEYEQGIRRTESAKALRMGTIWHDAMQILVSESIDAALQAVLEFYAVSAGEYEDPDEPIAYEREILFTLVHAYHWRWNECEANSIVRYLKVEEPFTRPIINPETGSATPIFELAGKIDGIVELQDGRFAVLERKLLGEDISPESEIWKRLRIDTQVTNYILGARRLGFAVDTVLYEPTRKPTIRPSKVPLLDEDGCKIVVDEAGNRVFLANGKPRQSADSAKGWTLQSRIETPEEFADRLAKDIQERPDFYFCQRELPRLESDVNEYESELWQIQQTIRDAQRNLKHYRTVTRDTCPFCPVFHLCTSGASWEPGQAEYPPLPQGFEYVNDIHQELL